MKIILILLAMSVATTNDFIKTIEVDKGGGPKSKGASTEVKVLGRWGIDGGGKFIEVGDGSGGLT